MDDCSGNITFTQRDFNLKNLLQFIFRILIFSVCGFLFTPMGYYKDMYEMSRQTL